MKVYLSSTYKDLKDYRTAIIHQFNSTALSSQFTLISMEGYVSQNGIKTAEECERDVENADVYILVVAENYGSIIEGTGISYTEHEYNVAVRTREKRGADRYKIFVFFSSALSEHADFAGESHTTLLNPAMKDFYNRVKHENARFVEPFISADNLCNQILLSLILNFSLVKNVEDYRRFLLLINRTTPIQGFSEAYLKRSNAFYFSAHQQNNADDFLTRLHENKLKKDCFKCPIILQDIDGINQAKFTQSVKGFLPSFMKTSTEELTGDFSVKSLIAIQITGLQLKEDSPQLAKLRTFLRDFLPIYFDRPGNRAHTDRLLLIYQVHNQEDTVITKKFEKFISSVRSATKTDFYNLDELKDVSRYDIGNWLESYSKTYVADQDELNRILKIQESDDPHKRFKMKEAKSLVKQYLEQNL